MHPDQSEGQHDRRHPSIPLRELQSTSDESADIEQQTPSTSRHAGVSSILSSRDAQSAPSYWHPHEAAPEGQRAESPIDLTALQLALPPSFDHGLGYSPSDQNDPSNPYDTVQLMDDAQHGDYGESDTAPLTASAQPISGTLAADSQASQPRDSFQTVSDTSLGQRDERGRTHNYGVSLEPNAARRSRSSSASGALHRAGSIVRAMSQRVVNISGESELLERHTSHRQSNASLQHSDADPSTTVDSSMNIDTSYHSPGMRTPTEKSSENGRFPTSPAHSIRGSAPNPLKGYSLGVFAPNSRIRVRLCNLLVNPYTEPAILLLIILQTILLAVEAAPNVFTPGNERPKHWGRRPIDWAMLALFIVFTLELIARTIVSGFIMNAAEYSSIDRRKGVKSVLADQYKVLFQPQRRKSTRASRQHQMEQPTITRSFTTIMQGQSIETAEDHQRFQLARRAFLRHSFNRLDFVAVISFWIDFAVSITGVEDTYHLYIFKMLSCLRILRLLALTNGTAIILKSLKKAAPLLVRVGFLICFFWLLFAIIGIQSFKSSLSRQCVWLDPSDPANISASYTNEEEFCGGHLDNVTGQKVPWVKFSTPDSLENLINGTRDGKGYLCPRGSICLEQDNPFNGTVNFDNIFHSLELVFVIMSANTFSDIMYYTMGSDYIQSALFFGAGIMIMTLWMTNLLIAVITSSFQVIREESKASAFTGEDNREDQPLFEERESTKSDLQKISDKSRWFFVLIIAFGLVSMACKSATMSDFRSRFVNNAEIVVTTILDLEIILRCAAYWRTFYRSRRILFDLGIAIITTVILLPPIQHSKAYPWLTVFQIVRVYRVVLAIPVTRKLILLVLGNAMGIGNLMLFVFLMTFLVAIFASQLFRGMIPIYDDGELNRISFFTIYNSFLGMYQILSSENWTDILYSVTSYTHEFKSSWIGAGFLIGWFVMSFFILVNMFIAVIQENFDVSEDEKRLEQVKAFLQRRELGNSASNLALSTIFSFGKSRRRKDPLDYGPAMMEMLLKDAVVRDFLDDENVDPGQDNVDDSPIANASQSANQTSGTKPGVLSVFWNKISRNLSNKEPNPFYSNIRFDGPNDTLDAREMARQAVSATAARRRAQREYLARHPNFNTSLYLFSPQNKFRRLCQRIVGPARGIERFDGVEPNKIAWYATSAVVYAAVVAMVILACITTPLYQKQYNNDHPDSGTHWYIWTDLAFTSIFTAEAIIKIVADGLLWTPNAYLRSSWGIMDAVVLITLWINAVTLFIQDGAISRAVGAFKALRALRLLNVSDSARDTFHSLIIVGWWKLFGAAFVSISLLIPFAIYGLNLFNGLMVTCNDSEDITFLNQCFGEYDNTPFSDNWPMLTPRVAGNSYFKFDDFGSSLFTLFGIVSQEGWTDVSFAAQAITGRGMQPQDLKAQGNALFFVVFNLLATVFVLTLFISVFMRNYTEQTGIAFLTAEQRSWLELRKLLRQISPSKSSYADSENTWKRWCHKRAIEKRGIWYQTVTAVLVVHLLLLVVEFSHEPAWWTRTRELLFLACTLVYLGNITIRIIGLGWPRFRKSSWDLYALLTVSGAFIATIALLGADTKSETYVQLHKFFLVAVVLLIIPRNDALDQLFKTAAASLPIISNLLATWLVLFLVFAIAMTQAFSLTRFGGSETNNLNFRTVPKAMILLFRMSLGEGWNEIMEDFAGIEPPLCVDDGNFFNSDCGSKPWARGLFVAWNILSMYIFVNLFVSLIYESFSYVYQRSSGMAVVDRDEIRRFKEAWRSVDPAGTGYISKEVFPRLLGELSGIFQMRIYEPEDSVRQILDDVQRDEAATHRYSSLATPTGQGSVDIARLNRRLEQLDVVQIRARRRRFNVFFEEVLVAADPDRGIAFTDVLLILAHYNIINDSKSLKLDEFLRRRARLQRVDEEIRRRTVQGFFDTLYWSRKFKQHMDAKRSSRMSVIPSLPSLQVPEIYIDDGESDVQPQSSSLEHHGKKRPNLTVATDLPEGNRSVWSGGTGSPLHRDRGHPLSFPRLDNSAVSPPGTPSAFSFDMQRSDGQTSPSRNATSHSGAVSPAEAAQQMLDQSVWIQSMNVLKRKTLRKSDRTSYRYGDIG